MPWPLVLVERVSKYMTRDNMAKRSVRVHLWDGGCCVGDRYYTTRILRGNSRAFRTCAGARSVLLTRYACQVTIVMIAIHLYTVEMI